MKEQEPSLPAMMEIHDGEEIAGMWVSTTIPGTGMYKLLAKRTAKGEYKWIHFLQRADGSKTTLFHGTAKSKDELQKVVETANTELGRIFGKNVLLTEGRPSFYSVDGSKHSDTIN